MLNKIKNLVVEEQGQAMAEYGLLLALIAVGVILAATALGTAIHNKFDSIATELGTTPAE